MKYAYKGKSMRKVKFWKHFKDHRTTLKNIRRKDFNSPKAIALS
jgi:hypothetical protein